MVNLTTHRPNYQETQYQNTSYPQHQNPQPSPSNHSSNMEKILKILERMKINSQVRDQLLHSHTQSIAKLETQIGQLATAFNRREKKKQPNQSISNPKGWYIAENSNAHEIFSKHTKSVMTLRNEKVLE